MKDISYKFYASPDGRRVAARLRGLRRKVLIMYGAVGLFSGVSIVLGLIIYNLLKGGM
jgi:hypothetical protein